MDLGGKVALITGAAVGMGFATAKEFLRNGVKHVTIADLETSDGKKSAETLNAEFGKGRAIFVACDIGRTSDFEPAFAKTIKEFGGLDIVVNNVGVLNEKQWEPVVNINLNGAIRGTQLGLKYMGKHNGGKGGVIVNIASVVGIDSLVWLPTYTATKHGIVGMGKCYGTPYYWELTGVRIITVCPGYTDTPMVAKVQEYPDLVDVNLPLRELAASVPQKPENVGRGVAEVIKSAKNGSIWVVENDEPIWEVSIPNYLTLRASSKE